MKAFGTATCKQITDQITVRAHRVGVPIPCDKIDPIELTQLDLAESVQVTALGQLAKPS